jgi:hypothetical protein
MHNTRAWSYGNPGAKWGLEAEVDVEVRCMSHVADACRMQGAWNVENEAQLAQCAQRTRQLPQHPALAYLLCVVLCA